MNRTCIKRLIDDQNGAVGVWVALSMSVLVGMAAIAVDTGYLYAQHNKLQVTADAAVLAASHEFMNSKSEADTRAVAVAYAERNMPRAAYGEILTDRDIEFGQWDKRSGFSALAPGAPAATANAIQVTLRRSAGGGNATETFFAKLLGENLRSMDMAVQSVAAVGSPGCNGGTMFMAGEKVQMGQDINLSAGTCVYGRMSVSAGQDPIVQDGAFIGALDINTITFGQNPSVPDGAVGEADIQPTMANNIDQTIADLMAGRNLPSHISRSEVVTSLPSTLDAGVAYVVDGSVTIGQDYRLTDVIIAATGSIAFGQDGKIRNSSGNCQIGGGTAIGLYAGANISIGQDVVIEGAQIVAGETITIGQDMRGLSASIEAGKDLVIGQDPTMSSCAAAIPSTGGGSSVASRLVR